MKYGIVIPCYNQTKVFDSESYIQFLSNETDFLLCFVNDGSTDTTLNLIEKLHLQFPNQTYVIDEKINRGKAEAVRIGINYLAENKSLSYVGFLDSDLATSLEECKRLFSYLNEDIHFGFGSRILRVGSTIHRKRSRFLIGRVIATFISTMLDLKVYDTQCGAKVFQTNLAKDLFKDSFISKWLFDVELFFRIFQIYGKEVAIKKMMEIPLNEWKEKGDSKVPLSYGLKVWFELWKIKRKYS